MSDSTVKTNDTGSQERLASHAPGPWTRWTRNVFGGLCKNGLHIISEGNAIKRKNRPGWTCGECRKASTAKYRKSAKGLETVAAYNSSLTGRSAQARYYRSHLEDEARRAKENKRRRISAQKLHEHDKAKMRRRYWLSDDLFYVNETIRKLRQETKREHK